MLDYLEPSECYYSKPQILWILNNCLEGWPSRICGYKDDISSLSINPHAPYESEMLVIIEITARLELCGSAGKKFYNAFLENKTIDATGICPIAVKPPPFHSCPMVLTCPKQGQLNWRCDSKTVLDYISGVCRKMQSCDRCLDAIHEVPKEHNSKLCKRWGRKPCSWQQWVGHRR